jgi:hypothetical protein
MGRIAVKTIASLALLAFGAFPASAAARSCERETVVNYRSPLEALPSVRPVPGHRRLPFGPARVRLSSIGYELPSGSSIQGFRLGHWPTGAVTLHWKLDVQLRRVSRSNPGGDLIATRQATIKRLKGHAEELTFPISSRSGIYRITIAITDADGRRLGRFGRYVRVLPTTSAATLSLLGGPFRPGEFIGGCLENRGTVPLQSGAARLERLEGTEWRRVVVGPEYAVSSSFDLRSFLAGEAERVFAYLPPDARPGAYRLAWAGQPLHIGSGPPSPIPGLPAVELSANFEVAAP